MTRSRNWVIDEYYLIDSMEDGSSIAAIDKDGNIVGSRLGIGKRRSNWSSWMFEQLPLFFSDVDVDVFPV